MEYSGDQKVWYAALSSIASGDQAEAPEAVYTCSRFIWLSAALTAVVFTVVILVTTAASVPPRLPVIAVASFTVSSLSFSTASSGVSSGDFSVTLVVRNPNREADIRSSKIVAGVYHDGAVVAEATLPPMYQVALAERTVTARLAAVAAPPHVGRGVARGVQPDIPNGGSSGVVRFRVESTCSLAFHVNGVGEASWRKVRVCCDEVPVRLVNATAPSTSGYLVGLRRPCNVK